MIPTTILTTEKLAELRRMAEAAQNRFPAGICYTTIPSGDLLAILDALAAKDTEIAGLRARLAEAEITLMKQQKTYEAMLAAALLPDDLRQPLIDKLAAVLKTTIDRQTKEEGNG